MKFKIQLLIWTVLRLEIFILWAIVFNFKNLRYPNARDRRNMMLLLHMLSVSRYGHHLVATIAMPGPHVQTPSSESHQPSWRLEH